MGNFMTSPAFLQAASNINRTEPEPEEQNLSENENDPEDTGEPV